jgi:uncharacterized protein
MGLAEEVRVIDADTHLTEVHDLWTSRAPHGYADRVPRVEKVDGRDTWLIDGTPFGPARGGGTIDPAGAKHPFYKSQTVWSIEEVHPAAWDPTARLALMDEFGVYAQVCYPSDVGIGGQKLANATTDPKLRALCVELYNDAMAEMQEASGNRLLPMPVLPAWSVQDSVREVRRLAAMGLRGVNMMSDPQETGAPDLASREWDPLWEACAGLALPLHFHIGSSGTAMDFYGKYFWPSQNNHVKPAIGGTMLFLGNARFIINTIYAGIFERHPGLKMVSVESGAGWVPFVLEAMDHELEENAPEEFAALGRKPSEYFADHWYATFWFEENRGDLQGLVDAVGEDNLLFETDFPHPTCLYPDPLHKVEAKMASLRPESRRKVLGENAAKLYRL